MSKARAVLIAGPTASGKSALALAVARTIGRAVIVNADSMQVYRDLDLLSARPSQEEEAQVPHRLFGHVDGAQAYSAARFVTDVQDVLGEARDRGLLPIIVGGTGLYFKVLLEGLSPVPAIDPAVRERWRAEAAERGATALHAELGRRDPVMAGRLVPTDTQRVTRALEVLEATGRSLAHWQQIAGTPVMDPASTARFVLSPPRAWVMERCDQRFDMMMRAGALDEIRTLAARALPPDLPVMRALGVPPLIAHVAGSLPLDEAVERAKSETRQFARRQSTWLRRFMIAWLWLDAQQTERNIEEIVSNIDF